MLNCTYIWCCSCSCGDRLPIMEEGGIATTSSRRRKRLTCLRALGQNVHQGLLLGVRVGLVKIGLFHSILRLPFLFNDCLSMTPPPRDGRRAWRRLCPSLSFLPCCAFLLYSTTNLMLTPNPPQESASRSYRRTLCWSDSNGA